MKFKIEFDLEAEGVNNMTIEFDLNNMVVTTVDNDGLVKQEKFTKKQLPKMLNHVAERMIKVQEMCIY